MKHFSVFSKNPPPLPSPQLKNYFNLNINIYMFLFLYLTSHFIIYRVTRKGWDCKDDLNLLKYDDSKVKLSQLPLVLYFNSL